MPGPAAGAGAGAAGGAAAAARRGRVLLLVAWWTAAPRGLVLGVGLGLLLVLLLSGAGRLGTRATLPAGLMVWRLSARPVSVGVVGVGWEIVRRRLPSRHRSSLTLLATSPTPPMDGTAPRPLQPRPTDMLGPGLRPVAPRRRRARTAASIDSRRVCNWDRCKWISGFAADLCASDRCASLARLCAPSLLGTAGHSKIKQSGGASPSGRR